MILAHLGDLHLGYRAYRRLEHGRNARERDVARAFQRAVQEVIRLEPAVMLLVGDVFDHPAPPPSALVTLARGVESLRAGLPDLRILAVAGRRDTPLSRADPGPVAALEAVSGVQAAAGTARSVHVEALDLHVLLVPYRALVETPYPELRPDPGSRWNVLVLPGGPGDAGPRLDPSRWDYVALGGGHSHREVAPGVHRAGSLERVGPAPWDEAAEEKGFVTWNLTERAFAFHLIPGRPVVELAPTPVDPADPGSINDRIREVVEGIPGGVEDKVVRLGIEGLGPRDQELLDARYLARIRRRALHLHVEIRPDSDPPPRTPPRDRAWLARRLREALRAAEGFEPDEVERAVERGDEILAASPDPGSAPSEPGSAPVRLEGTDPVLGRVSADVPEGLVALVAEDHRAREALTGLLGRRVTELSGEMGSRLLRPGPDDLADLLEAATRIVARTPALRRLEEALREEDEEPPGKDADLPDPAPPADPEEELLRLAGRIRRLEGIPEELRALERELRELRATSAEVAGDLEFRTMEWLRERQDAETQLQAYRDRARELKARYGQIESAGEEASCPTCGRPLGDHREEVIAELREEWESVVQDGQWWKRRREQLEPKPEHLQELESRSVRLHAAIEDLTERLERRRAEMDDVNGLREREADLRERLADGGAGRGGGAGEEPSHVTLLRRSVKRVAEELRDEARERILIRAGAVVGTISDGRYGGLTAADGTLAFVQDGAPGRILSGAERAMVRLALRMAGAAEAGEAAGGRSLLLVGPDLDALDQEGWEGAVRALRSVLGHTGRVVAVTRRERVERVPEGFDAVLEVHPPDEGREGGPRVRRLPVAPGTVRLA